MTCAPVSRSADGVGEGMQQRLGVAGLEVGQRLAHRWHHAGEVARTLYPPAGRVNRNAALALGAGARCHAARHPQPRARRRFVHVASPSHSSPRSPCAIPAAGAQAFTLHVVHFNDFHSRIESINAFEFDLLGRGRDGGRVLRRRGAAGDGGRRACAREAAGENVLVLNAGDVFQGSLFFTAYSGQAEAEMMNRIGLDAMVYGNHEFDLGPEPLAKFIEAAELPGDLRQRRRLRPTTCSRRSPLDHLVLEVGGEKVAILGAITPDTAEISSPGPTVSFRAPIDYLTRRGGGARGRGRGQDHPRSATSASSATRRSPRRCPGSTSSSAATATRSSPTPPRTRRSSTRSWSTAPTAMPCPSCRPAPTPSTSATSRSPSTTRAW